MTITSLNDFIFCPYSIYLHNVYMDTDEDNYKASPQIRGKYAHEATDKKTSSTRAYIILSLPVYSEKYHLMGKIDVYNAKDKKLIERKYKLKQIFRGQIYQLWAQMFCLKEMGYEVESLAFYEISTKKFIDVAMPTEQNIIEFEDFMEYVRNYDPSTPMDVNKNKCSNCIYSNLCDKIEF
ncbi:MAG: type V CRISPR-associated protein Cas4 [Bacteroidaceae bacterium]|nr:type V CRISPR-associated protein Cas4 [Bacteroidaceae bacterium]